MNYKRLFIEKKKDFDSKASLMEKEIREYLKIELGTLRLVNIYDVIGASEEEIEIIKDKILCNSNLLNCSESLNIAEDDRFFRVKFLESQFNQAEDSANKLVELIIGNKEIHISNTLLYILEGVNEDELKTIKKYFINPVEVSEIPMDKVLAKKELIKTDKVETIDDFYNLSEVELEAIKDEYGIGLDIEDLQFCQDYFKSEKRNPTITELKLIDTYWSDHCRHTTFMTEITNIAIEEGRYEKLFQETLEEYLNSRSYVYEDKDREICLMDLATINQKEIKKKGLLSDKEETDEVNAASIEIDVDVDGKNEKWLLMFKNETHNHPTEIEPFGGAATCLGGAIRDPLSGRSYVYQAMRITGAADPRSPFEETMDGKLPQRKIVQTARDGYSSYGYEIGAATGYVEEIYHPGYMAKRMEVGALVAAAPKENVYRGQAEAGDVIVLVGGRTGRDGVGGAVGSSKKHTEESLEESGSEVQKGNAKVERKILRLFRKKEVAEMIKVCNDFGAGGVSVAIGELADGVKIDLDKVPLKYKGLDGTEIALSESQERMAAVIDRENLDKFLKYSEEEDLEATLVAEVTEEKVLKMFWRGDEIVSIDRVFLDTNGIRKKNEVEITQPEENGFFQENWDRDFLANLKDINVSSQKGLIESFDSTVGKSSVLSPLGGEKQITPAESMVAKIPVLNGQTNTCSLMSYGFDPKITSWSCYHGGYFAVIESVARIVATGGSYENIRLSFQEYFERIGEDPKKWGKPFAALLGAYKVQKELDIPAIGGKDSMSGSFEDLHVPPTIISFAVTTDKVDNIISPEFKHFGSRVGLIKLNIDEDNLIDLNELKSVYKKVKEYIDKKDIISASTVKYGGIARSIAEMSLGNQIGFNFESDENIYDPFYGSLVVELREGLDSLEGVNFEPIGLTTENKEISLSGKTYSLEEVYNSYIETLDEVYPVVESEDTIDSEGFRENIYRTDEKVEKVKVLIPVVTGTHGEYDMEKSFTKVGAEVDTFVIKTFDKEVFDSSIEELSNKLKDYHILALPDGQILGGEPGGSYKLTSHILSMPAMKEAIENHLAKKRLIIGIGAGCETLIKTGLIEHSKITDKNLNLDITYNKDLDFISRIIDVKVVAKNSAWLSKANLGENYKSALASKRARILVSDYEKVKDLVSTVSLDNIASSNYAIDSLSSRCGLIYASVSSPERMDDDLVKNIKGNKNLNLFQAAVSYFK